MNPSTSTSMKKKKKKKKKKKATIFSWSLQDIFNKDLYRNKVSTKIFTVNERPVLHQLFATVSPKLSQAAVKHQVIRMKRHCLWILGNERTLVSQENVWKTLVLDEDKDLVKAIWDARKELDQLDDLLNANSVIFRNSRWKVLFSDKFLKSFKNLPSKRTKESVISLLLKLSSGWRPKRMKVDLLCRNSSQMLKQYKVEGLFVVCSKDIVKESNFTQVLRIWDVLPPKDIPKVVKRLESIFGRYTNDFISRCSEQCFEGTMEVPMTWERSTETIKIKNVDNNGNEDESASLVQRIYVENSKVEESFILLKLYSLSTVVVSEFLSDRSSDKLELPFEVSDEKQDIILFSRSTFVLGRSGAGKTTVLTMKLLLKKEELHHLALEHTYGIKSVETPCLNYDKEYKDSSTVNDRPVLHQLFVTVSPKLSQAAVKHQVIRMKSLKSAIKVKKGDENVAATSRLSQTSAVTRRMASHLSHYSKPTFKTTFKQKYTSDKNSMLFKRGPTTLNPQIIVPYPNDMHNPEHSGLTIIEFPQDPIIIIDDTMDSRFSIGDTCLSSVIRGLVFVVGRTYHQVGNPVSQTLSNRSHLPTIDPDFQFDNHFLGYDGFRNRYKVVRFRNIEGGAGTVIHCFNIGSELDHDWRDDDWREVAISELTVSVDQWLPNEGVHTLESSSALSVNQSSRFYLLCFEILPTGSRWEYILCFDCESEQVRIISLPLVVGNPILCCLANKLCCAAFLVGFLTIHQLEGNNSWIVLIDVYIPRRIDPLSYLPICLRGERLLLAFCGNLPGDPDFVNRGHGILLDVITGDVELIDTSEDMHWFSAMSFTQTLELLPY